MSQISPGDGFVTVDSGVEDGIAWATCKAPVYGAVNGYVQIPPGHPWRGKGYDDIDVEAHGGLTYGSNEDGWVGFDTMHAGDFWPGMPAFMDTPDAKRWTPAMVVEEARRLAGLVAEAAEAPVGETGRVDELTAFLEGCGFPDAEALARRFLGQGLTITRKEAVQ